MSISLPNGTILAAPSSSAQMSAAVTRILHLSNFSAELKTRDLQAIFKDWDNDKGGFRIKWLDDVNALVVFADASVAKRAYLSLLLSPPPTFSPPSSIKPYDRPDAASIIQSLASRQLGHRNAMSTALQSSSINLMNLPPPSSFPSTTNTTAEGIAIHSRAQSVSNPNNTFKMPLVPSNSNNISGLPRRSSTNAALQNGNGIGSSVSGITAGGGGAGSSRMHHRSGSASSSWARSGGGGGALNFSFPTSGLSGNNVNRLPTMNEAITPGFAPGNGNGNSRSASSSSGETPVLLMETNAPAPAWSGTGSVGKGRRESLSAERAMREVEKALASVEAQG